MRHKLLFLTLASIILVAVLNFTAMFYYFYWIFAWFDNVVHFFGGFAIGLLAIWIYFQSGLFKKIVPEKRQAILTSIVCVLIIGIGWEIFENLNGLTQSTESYPLDIVHDLISDFIGSVVAGGLAANKKLYG